MGDTGSLNADANESGHVEVDLGAIVANLAEIRRLAGRRRVIATVKADAYGHGCVAVARVLQDAGVEYFAAGNLDDAAAMRAAGIRTPIVLLSGLRGDMIGRVLALDLIATVSDVEMAEALAAASSRPVSVFVEVDCGFGRFGVPMAEAYALMRRLASVDRLRVEGIYTHNSLSDSASLAWAKARLADFTALLATLEKDGLCPPVTQALASSGLFAGFEDGCNAVAIGHVLYGLHSVGPALRSDGKMALQPAMTAMKTRLVNVGRRPPDGQVAAYLRNVKGPIGVVPIGTCHAYRPTAPEAFMIVGGRTAPILRVALENAILDLSGIDTAPDDEVLLLGSDGNVEITIEMLAAWQGTSVLAMVTGLGRALPRRYRS